MSFGKLYSNQENPRTKVLLAVAKENKLDVELVNTAPPDVSIDYFKLNGLGKIPTFVGANGYILTECIAIAVYFTSQNEKTTLLGKTKQDYASILRWMSFANSEVLPTLAGWYRPLIGKDPYNKKSVEDSQKRSQKVTDVLEQHFLIHTYLVGERVTLADLFVASIISRGFEFVLDKTWRNENPNTTRWFETVINSPLLKANIDRFPLVAEAVKYTPPKKEAKPKAEAAPKAAPKAKKEEEDDDEPIAEAPKAKHPLESLGKPTLILDDWKRKYSNEDTRSGALPWFWENYKPEEYSLWKVDYKDNDQLTLTFMSSNLIGGFFARLEASRKYLFGAASVYGVSNDSVIQGAFLVRGQEALPAFDVAPDCDSYEFTKLDPTKEADKEFVNDQWAWDKPITVNGKLYEWADGKVSNRWLKNAADAHDYCKMVLHGCTGG